MLSVCDCLACRRSACLAVVKLYFPYELNGRLSCHQHSAFPKEMAVIVAFIIHKGICLALYICQKTREK